MIQIVGRKSWNGKAEKTLFLTLQGVLNHLEAFQHIRDGMVELSVGIVWHRSPLGNIVRANTHNGGMSRDTSINENIYDVCMMYAHTGTTPGSFRGRTGWVRFLKCRPNDAIVVTSHYAGDLENVPTEVLGVARKVVKMKGRFRVL